MTSSLGSGKFQRGILLVFSFLSTTLLHLPPADSTVSEDNGIEPRTVATWHWESDALTTKLDLIHSEWQWKVPRNLSFPFAFKGNERNCDSKLKAYRNSIRMRFGQGFIASESPVFNSSIPRHSGNWGATHGAVFNREQIIRKSPQFSQSDPRHFGTDPDVDPRIRTLY